MKGHTDDRWDVVVVGGGPSGMVAAARAAERGLSVVLLEKNTVLGAKLLLTGGGRCNITNATSDRHVLIARYGEKGVHLHSLFSRFTPDDTRSLFRRLGLETKVEAEGRVFPVTESAVSVRDALEGYLTATGVVIRRNTTVAGIEIDGDAP
ncbi:MAG: FAD-dependent oxidoreductase, partial [Alkalispirochaeta sp.]